MSTMLPFLYQTRTLSGLTWHKVQPRNGTFVRKIGSSIRRRGPPDSVAWKSATTSNESPNPDTSALESPEPEFRISRRTVMHAPEPSPGFWDYRGETILQKPVSLGSKTSAWSPNFNIDLSEGGDGNGQDPKLIRKYWDSHFEENRAAEAEFYARPGDNIGFDEDILHNMPLDNSIQSLTSRSQPRESTITASERHAFQRIFENIFKRDPEVNKSEDTVWNSYDDNIGYDNSARIQKPVEKTAYTRETQVDIQEAIDRYPPALRAAATKAFRVVEKTNMLDELEKPSEPSESSEANRINLSKQLDSLREPERIRVTGLMREATTDFELWKVLEQEVFPLIKTLGLEEKKPEEKVEPTKVMKRGRKRKMKEATKAEDIVEKPQESAKELPLYLVSMGEVLGVSPVAIYAPLYSEYLLFALRMLDRAFAKPSPLALSILPKLKSLGLISHILGGSTQFYNELMRIHALRLDDFRGMLSFLEEMENAAVDFDEGTLEVVNETLKSHEDAKSGVNGEAIKALWGMPEYEYSRLRKWKEEITKALEEKELETRSRLDYKHQT